MRKRGTGKVFRRSTTEDGAAKQLPSYYYWFIDVDGRKKTRKGYTDKAATEEALRREQKRIARQLEGLSVPSETELRRPLLEHIDDFLEHLAAGGVTEKHLSMSKSRLMVAFTEMNIKMFSDMSVTKVERFVLDLRRRDYAQKTINDYVAIMKQLTSWLADTKGWDDPLASLDRLQGQDDIRRKRMALTPEQVARLLDAAERRSVENYLADHPSAKPETIGRFRHYGLQRATIYRLGALAGLRPTEIKNLTWACIDLEGQPPTITVEAKYAKSRREDTVPLNGQLVAALRRWRWHQTERVAREPAASENVVCVPRHLSDEQFPKDCEFAGIATEDEKGRVLDLYAATRHTFCTLLAAAGTSPHRQRLLMRHVDLATTLKYTHLQVIDLVEGIEALPQIEDEEAGIPAEHVRNARCSEAQEAARTCNEDASKEQAEGEGEGGSKGLPLQEIASPCNSPQGDSNSLPEKELWWRRRESNPRPEYLLLKLLRT